MSFTMHC